MATETTERTETLNPTPRSLVFPATPSHFAVKSVWAGWGTQKQGEGLGSVRSVVSVAISIRHSAFTAMIGSTFVARCAGT